MRAPTVTLLRTQLAERRGEAIRSFREHLRPELLITALRRVMDQTLLELLKSYPLPPGSALAAVGGYGRGELYPYSDVDVLVLLHEPPSDDDNAMIEALIAAMWDLGVEPGQDRVVGRHAVDLALLQHHEAVGPLRGRHRDRRGLGQLGAVGQRGIGVC